MESVTVVAIPGWAAGVLSICFAAFVGWAIHDRVRVGEMLIRIRERLSAIEVDIRRKVKGED